MASFVPITDRALAIASQTLRSAPALLAAIALALAPRPAGAQLDVTYLGNAGFLLEGGGRRVLVDAFGLPWTETVRRQIRPRAIVAMHERRGGDPARRRRVAEAFPAARWLSRIGESVRFEPASAPGDAAEKVREAERAFARTMAERDPRGFARFVSEEAVFLGREVLRGRDAVAEGWRPYFEGEAAPFSWEPERVVVLESGDLALSTGPVYDPSGERVGTFNSTWRREADGVWRVVFDVGCPPCGRR